KVTVPSAPECAAGRLDDASARAFRKGQHLAHLGFGTSVISQIDAWRRSAEGDAGILFGARTGKKGQDRSAHLEKGHAVSDAVPHQAHRLVESGHAVEIVHRDSYDGNARFHLFEPKMRTQGIVELPG